MTTEKLKRGDLIEEPESRRWLVVVDGEACDHASSIGGEDWRCVTVVPANAPRGRAAERLSFRAHERPFVIDRAGGDA